MSNRSETPEKKPLKQPIVKLNYCLKPKLIRNTPLNKYDLNQLQSIDASGAQITDHFNYGFNSETFPVYVKLCKRFVQVEDIEHPNRPYDPTTHHQFRFNDDAPIDFGGFGPFLDQEFSDVCNNDQFESLMQCFVTIPFAQQGQRKGHNTMINYLEYLKYDQAYPTLSQFMEEIERKIEEKYERTMKILRKHEKAVNMITQKIDCQQVSSSLTEEAKDSNFYEDLLNFSLKSTKKENFDNKKITKKQLKSEEESRSQPQDSFNNSLSYSNIQESESSDASNDESRRIRYKNDRKYKEKLRKKQHKEPQSHSHKKKKSKSKKIGRQKSHKSHKKHKKHRKHSKKHKR